MPVRNGQNTYAILVSLTILLLGAGARAEAQEPYLFRLALLGGVGAALDADRNNSFEQSALGVALGMVTNERTQVALRLGRIEFDRRLGRLDGARLDYGLVGGEYRFDQSYYDFGISLGLGGYRLQGQDRGQARDTTALGLGLGLVGDFDVHRHLAITAEASVHYAFFERSPYVFSTALVGLAIRF